MLRPNRVPGPSSAVLPPCPTAADTHSSGLIQHQLLDRADDGGSGRGHGSGQERPHHWAAGRGSGRDTLRGRPRRQREETPQTPPPARQIQLTKTLSELDNSAARSRRLLPDSLSPASQQAPPIVEGRGYRIMTLLRADPKDAIFLKGRKKTWFM